MSLTQVFVERKRTGPSFKVEKTNSTFFVDASLSESYNHSAELTDNPVEEGIDVTDNINIKPIEIELTMRATETPINLEASIKGAVTTLGSKIGQSFSGAAGAIIGGAAPGILSGIINGSNNTTRTRVQTNYLHFKDLLEKKALLTVQTGLYLYEKMVIYGLRINRNPNTGQALDFTVSLRQLRYVTSAEIDLPEIDEQPVADTAAPITNLGKQSEKEINEQEQSLLAAGFDSVLGFFQ